MASRSEEELCCLVCHDIYTDPVILSCRHSFCAVCLENWWKTKDTRDCPLCKTRILDDLTSELEDQQPARSVCKLHSEDLKLFCVDHQQPVCLVCRDSEKHTGHKFRPINEAAPVFRGQLEQGLQILKDKLLGLNESKEMFSAAEIHVETQARLTERQIRKQFKKFHQHLVEEEQVRIKAVREEEEQKRKNFKDKMAVLTKEIEALSEIISATEYQLGTTDVFFLLHYKSAEERVQHCPLQEEPQLEPGSLLDQAKHLGNLSFEIWTDMKEAVQFYPVILDPNTAHPELILSENLTGVRFEEGRMLPGNPERFELYRWVLGSEGLSLRTHSWIVEVSGDGWTVGVLDESIKRKSPVKRGVWKMFLYNGKYFAYSPPNPVKRLSVKTKLQKVGVNVDFDRETVSFFDANTKVNLYTFPNASKKIVFPYFETFSNEPLKILPVQFSSIVFNP